MLCLMLAWIVLTGIRLTKIISRCWARYFSTTPKLGEREIHQSASTGCLNQTTRKKDQLSGPSQISSGTYACTLAQREQGLFVYNLQGLFLTKVEAFWHATSAWERNKVPLKAWDCLYYFYLPFQTMSVFHPVWAHFCNFLVSCGFTSYGVCTMCCSLTLAKVAAFPVKVPTLLQHVWKASAFVKSLLTLVKVSHSDSTAQSFLQLLTCLLRNDGGVCPWGWQSNVRGLELVSNEFSLVLTTALCDTYG